MGLGWVSIEYLLLEVKLGWVKVNCFYIWVGLRLIINLSKITILEKIVKLWLMFGLLFFIVTTYIFFNFQIIIIFKTIKLINNFNTKFVWFEMHFSNEKKKEEKYGFMQRKNNIVILHKFLFINLWYLLSHYLSFKLFKKIIRLNNQFNSFMICLI